MRGIGRIAGEAWRDLGGDASLLERIRCAGPELVLPSRLDVAGLAADSVAVAMLATQVVLRDRGLAGADSEISVDASRLATSVQSERHLRVRGVAPDAWATLSGFWKAEDGWVRTHGNYPHHANRLRRLLGVADDATREQIATAITRLQAQELEDHAARLGAIVVRVRSEAEWEAHRQGVASASAPLIDAKSLPGRPRHWIPRPERPLDGIRVLDMTRVIAGPVAARDLAFAGADVLRVDPPGMPEIDWQHVDTGQGKRSTLLDLGAPGDRGRFEDLLGQADVLITGYRPGSLERFGFTREQIAERRPGLVVGSVSAWGTHGPWAGRRGFDSIVQAASGIAMVESEDGVTPGALPAQALDHSAGHFLAAGVIAALAAQRREGGTRFVDVALARVARALLDGPRWETKRAADVPRPALQRSGGDPDELVTALPVLTYPGAPWAYPRIGGGWGLDAPEWISVDQR